jgi:hypothetical protein
MQARAWADMLGDQERCFAKLVAKFEISHKVSEEGKTRTRQSYACILQCVTPGAFGSKDVLWAEYEVSDIFEGRNSLQVTVHLSRSR